MGETSREQCEEFLAHLKNGVVVGRQISGQYREGHISKRAHGRNPKPWLAFPAAAVLAVSNFTTQKKRRKNHLFGLSSLVVNRGAKEKITETRKHIK